MRIFQEKLLRTYVPLEAQVHSSEKGSLQKGQGGPNPLSQRLGRGDLAKAKKAGRTISPGHSDSVEVQPTLLLLLGNK